MSPSKSARKDFFYPVPDAAWGRRRGCCRARCAEGLTIVSSPRRRRHLLLAAALPFPAIAQTNTHTRAHTHTLLMIEY